MESSENVGESRQVSVQVLEGTVGVNGGEVRLYRDASGKILPGSNPPRALSPGRPKQERLYKQALAEKYPPEKLVKMYEEAWEMAKEQKSAKAMHQIAADIADRLSGKPIATNVQIRPKLSELFEQEFGAVHETNTG